MREGWRRCSFYYFMYKADFIIELAGVWGVKREKPINKL